MKQQEKRKMTMKRQEGRLEIGLALVTALLGVSLPAFSGSYPGPNAARIAEIAAHIDELPGLTEPFPEPNSGKARKDLADPIPDCPDDLYLRFSRDGNRKAYEKSYFGRLSMLTTLAAMAAQKDGAYLEKAERILLAICDERSWTMPAHDKSLSNFNGTRLTIDLGSSHRAYAMAAAVTHLKDRLKPETVARVRAEVERRIFALYRATNRDVVKGDFHGNWWFYVRSNWNAVCQANVVRAALMLVEDRNERAAYVEAAERGMHYFLESFLPDGYCTEGGGYWNYGYGHFLELTRAVKKVTGGYVDFSGLPRAKEAMAYGFNYRLSGDVCPVFADGGGGAATRDRLEIGAELWPEFKPNLDGKLPARTWFPDAQVYIGRSQRLAFGVKGGNNDELHNHNDVGSWTLLADGVEVAGDPGGETYTARTFSKDRYVSDVLNSFGHPVPVVDGALQSAGAKFAAKVLSTSFGDAEDVVAYDITAAYKTTSNRVESLVREIRFNRAADKISIGDRVKFASPAAFESALVTYSDVRKTADGRGLALTHKSKNGKSTVGVTVTVETEGGDWEWDERTIQNPGKPSPRRLAVRFKNRITAARVTWRVAPADQ